MQTQNLQNTTDSLKELIQEQSQKLLSLSKINQELQDENQKVLEEMRQLQTQLLFTKNLNQRLALENDSLRNKNGLLLREQQEKLEKEIEGVRDRNSKLERLVDMSSVEAVEQANADREVAILEAQRKIHNAEKLVSDVRKKNQKDVKNVMKKYEIKVKVAEKKIHFLMIVGIISVAINIIMWFICQ